MVKPKIGVVITRDGIESITIMGGPSERSQGNALCSELERELSDFESLIKHKFGNGFNDIDGNLM